MAEQGEGGSVKTWRDEVRPLIAAVLAEAEAEGWTDKERRKRLIAARPYWVRTTSHGQKIWRSEVKVQLGLVQFPKPRSPAGTGPSPHDDPRQPALFGGDE